MRQRLRSPKDTTVVREIIPLTRGGNDCVVSKLRTGGKRSLKIVNYQNLQSSTALCIPGHESRQYTTQFTPQFMRRFHWISQAHILFHFYIIQDDQALKLRQDMCLTYNSYKAANS
ncbi:unnamed protein product [Auanema sp. JU1783]|nr:unnamed protein product [Auanema sp. JU1783]